jgi:Ser/Thr protein kinase RdoA (MazF antagonist)
MEAHESNFPCGVAVTYGLHPRAVSKLPGGYVNESWRVECEEANVVVRRYGRLRVTRSALLSEHGVMIRAAERLPQVYPPLADAQGSTVHDIDGGFVAVLPFVEGETGARDPAARRRCAKLLARFHAAMHDVPIEGEMPLVRSADVLEWFSERFIELARDPIVGKKLDWNVAIAAATGASRRLASAGPQLPTGIIHGDVQPANFVHRGGTVVGLIDFDFTERSERAYDVAVGMDEFGTDFVADYDQEIGLGTAEREALSDLRIRRNAMMVWYIVTRHGERLRGDVGNASRYLDRLREMDRCRTS